MYKRMQGGRSLDPVTNDEEQRQAMYEEFGVTHGTPGSATEEDVRGRLSAILESGQSRDARLDLLDALHWYTVNNVLYGGVSDVLEEVDSASRTVLYEKDGEQ
jgi:hypothetical protein